VRRCPAAKGHLAAVVAGLRLQFVTKRDIARSPRHSPLELPTIADPPVDSLPLDLPLDHLNHAAADAAHRQPVPFRFLVGERAPAIPHRPDDRRGRDRGQEVAGAPGLIDGGVCRLRQGEKDRSGPARHRHLIQANPGYRFTRGRSGDPRRGARLSARMAEIITSWFFAEVKGPGDALRESQGDWIGTTGRRSLVDLYLS
jgi:hypothetical protein